MDIVTPITVQAVIRAGTEEIKSVIAGKGVPHKKNDSRVFGWVKFRINNSKHVLIMHYPQGVFRNREELNNTIATVANAYIEKRIS